MTEPNSEIKTVQKEICDNLLQLECCYRCCIRYLGNNSYTKPNYEKPAVTLQELGLNVDVDRDIENSSAKRLKRNFCIVCLDIFEDNTIDTLLKPDELQKVSEYDCPTFYVSITSPKACMLRHHAMVLYLQRTFPNYYKGLIIESLSKVWRRSFCNLLKLKFNKAYKESERENLEVQFHYEYPHDDEECKLAFKGNRKRDVNTSRTYITEILRDSTPSIFREGFEIPPTTPVKGVASIKLICRHDCIYFAGRYCKYARNIGQTPWLKGGTQIYTSVQEIIFKELTPIFNCAEMVFTSSGREDCDVRMLGRGRPFIVKIVDPKITTLTFDQCREIERKIAMSKNVKIRDFQRVLKSTFDNIKTGEENKRKTYQAKCFLPNHDNLEKHLKIINGIKDLTIKQRTPVRVLHRRTNSERSKMIYSMQAKIDSSGPPGYILINITSQAGTYIKEFIHGDLGRTKQSLGDILNDKIEFVSLDVMDIDLDFPPSISTSK